MIRYIVFVALLVVQSAGQILEKKGITQLSQLSDIQLMTWEFVHRAITNIYLVTGVTCVGVGFILWLYLLSQFELSYIYPLASILYILVAVLSYFVLGETMTPIRMVGIFVISIGCVLINIK